MLNSRGSLRMLGRTAGMVVLIGYVLAACSKDPVAPSSSVKLTSEVVPGITLALTAEPGVIRRGDTIHFRAVATNSTMSRVQIGMQCGPALDVVLTARGGQTRSALMDFVGAYNAFTCELGPDHFLEANTSRVILLKWPAPLKGSYRAAAGLRRADGIGNLSAPIPIVVTSAWFGLTKM